MSDNIPKLDAIYDDLTHLKNEFNELLDTYNEELQTLSKNIKITSKSNRKEIIKANGIFQKRFERVNEIITNIDDMSKEIEVNLIVLSAKKLELDEIGSTDNQFVICYNKLKQIQSEYHILSK